MKRNKGISLIVLVITIIIILILAGAVILSLIQNNPIGQSKEAQFKANIDAYNSELNMAISEKYFANYNFNPDTFDVPVWDGTGDGAGTIKEFVPSITDNDAKKFKIEDSKLVYVGTDELEIAWFAQIVTGGSSETPPVETGLGIDVIATKNTTFDGNTATYNNPIIPKGFKAINDGTTWPTDWNLGLVIEDESGNQFVWVPVDGSNVPYAKWCTTNISHSSTSDDTILSGAINEQTQIDTYGGFYIARYEAGNSSSVLVSKKAAAIWTDINYTNSKSKAEAMYNTSEVKSGLVTGKQWDTVMKWVSNNSGPSVTDSRAWGNYNNSTGSAATGSGTKKTAGYSEYWKAKNIYDLAGNVWEWSNEIYSSYRVYRGGGCDGSGSTIPAACRSNYDPASAYSILGFRVVLYIL